MTNFASQKYDEIVTLDEDKGKILRTPTQSIRVEDWDLVLQTVEKLLYVRNEILKGGAGLAAPQIGIFHSIFIYTPDRKTENLRVVINPIFEPIGNTTIEGHEACFSVPLKCTKLKRWEKIKARYQTLEGEWVEEILEGFEAKVFQHEMDHLNGKLIIDHVSAEIMTFNDTQGFEEFMKQVHVDDSLRYRKI